MKVATKNPIAALEISELRDETLVQVARIVMKLFGLHGLVIAWRSRPSARREFGTAAG